MTDDEKVAICSVVVTARNDSSLNVVGVVLSCVVSDGRQIAGNYPEELGLEFQLRVFLSVDGAILGNGLRVSIY